MGASSRMLRAITQTQFSVALTALATLVTAGSAKLLIVLLLFQGGVRREFLQGQDAFLTGILAACFVWFFLEVERARQKEQEMQVKVVADLNHHLRNALEVILSSNYLRESEKGTAILESVVRIEDALKIILPERNRREAASRS